MNVFERAIKALDRWQQRHPAIAFPFAVTKKFGDDRGGQLAALLAYYGFFSLFPLLAVATATLSRVLRDSPDLQQRLVDSALRNLPLVGDRIGRGLPALNAGGLALAVAIGLSLWAGIGAIKAFEHAMHAIWNVPYRRRPNFWTTNGRAVVLLVVVAMVVAASAVVTASAAGTNGLVATSLRWLVSALLNAAGLWLVFRIATVREVSGKDLFRGALVGGIAWAGLLAVGTYYVERQVTGASEVYGTFALVIGLLAWMYLGATVVLYAAEINVVRAWHLWPRSLVQPPLTDADTRALIQYAREAERRPEVIVEARLEDRDDEADASAGGPTLRDPSLPTNGSAVPERLPSDRRRDR